MNQDLVEIYKAANAQQAHLLAGRLGQLGIRAVVQNEALQGAVGELPLGWQVAPRVMVAGDDADRTRQVALDCEEQLARHADGAPQQVADEDGRPFDWPTCPQCDALRQTICPVCQVAGNDFPLADQNDTPAPLTNASLAGIEELEQAPSDELPLMLMCATCDEAFEPQFYRRCQWCGHDFADGLESPDPAGSEAMSDRTKMVATALLLGAAASVIYLAWLLYWPR